MKPLHVSMLICAICLCSCVSGAAGRTAKTPTPEPSPQAVALEPTPIPTPTPAPPVLVTENKYFADGVLDQYIVYTWSPDYRHLLSRATFEANMTEPDTRVAFDYSGDNPVSETIFEKDGSVRLKKKFIYDEAGRKIEEQHVDAKGKLILSYRKKFDEAGRTSSWSIFDSGGLPLAENQYIYENNRPASIKMKDGFGELVGTVRLTCDAKGRETLREYLGPDKAKLSSEVVYYDGDLPSKEEKRGADGAVLHTVSYLYGSGGELVRRIEIDGHGSTVSMTAYVYMAR
jgi:hypothetical protein